MLSAVYNSGYIGDRAESCSSKTLAFYSLRSRSGLCRVRFNFRANSINTSTEAKSKIGLHVGGRVDIINEIEST